MGWLSFKRGSNIYEHNDNGYCLAGEVNFPGICLGPGNPFRTASRYDCSVDINVLRFGSRVYGLFLVGEGMAQKFEVSRSRGSYFSILPPTIFSLNCQEWSFGLNRRNSSPPFRFSGLRFPFPISHSPGFLSYCFIEGSLFRLLGFLSFVLTVLSLPFYYRFYFMVTIFCLGRD